MMSKTSILILVVVLNTIFINPTAAWGSNDPGKVLLKDVQVLTLKAGQMTTGRRSSPVPQLNCVGGSAKGQFNPQVVQCYNRGWDGQDVQWECKSDMDNLYRYFHLNLTECFLNLILETEIILLVVLNFYFCMIILISYSYTIYTYFVFVFLQIWICGSNM